MTTVEIDIPVPDVPPISNRARTLDEAKAFLTRHLLTGRMSFPREAHGDILQTIRHCRAWMERTGPRRGPCPLTAMRRSPKPLRTPRRSSPNTCWHTSSTSTVGIPPPYDPDKLERYQRGIANFLRAAPLLDPPVEVIRIPFEKSEVVCYLRKPRGVVRPPVVFAWAGIDTWKEEMTVGRSDHYLEAGFAVLTTEMPGTRQSPVLGSPDAERQYTPGCFERPRTRDDLQGHRVVVVGGSFGGYWGDQAGAHAPPVSPRRGQLGWWRTLHVPAAVGREVTLQ